MSASYFRDFEDKDKVTFMSLKGYLCEKTFQSQQFFKSPTAIHKYVPEKWKFFKIAVVPNRTLMFEEKKSCHFTFYSVHTKEEYSLKSSKLAFSSNFECLLFKLLKWRKIISKSFLSKTFLTCQVQRYISGSVSIDIQTRYLPSRYYKTSMKICTYIGMG